MSITRRQFLKIAGASVIVGLGGISVINILQRGQSGASEALRDPEALVGKRWAMVIDIKRLDEETMRRCIDTCHRIHNVPDLGTQKEEIKWLWEEAFKYAFPGEEHEYMGEEIKYRPLLVLCNQCDNPPCVRVCPTKATFRRQDGIVMQDMHRCIGCRFCMAGCPYGARSFNWRDPRPFIKEMNREYPARMIGVVEKCTFCYVRLARGQKPACVEESKGALIFGDLGDPDSEVSKILRLQYTMRRKPKLGTRPGVYYLI